MSFVKNAQAVNTVLGTPASQYSVFSGLGLLDGGAGTGLARLVEGGIPTEATVAHVPVSQYADHLPFL
ncbi:MAG TPA: hypothetical protein VGN91_15115 [Bosea sp. (in: a-proteobacteria)]|nr:hypothetical protein [Bosea sp. (in: a-proteobacteria)]